MNRVWLDRLPRAALWGFLIFLVCVSAARAEKRVVLVIGNAAYSSAAALTTPVKDAKAMAEMFQKAGYEASTVYDANDAEFRKAIRQFDDAATDADVAVIYYAGHGIAVNGVNYLIPVDSKLASDWDVEDELIPLDRFIAAVVQAKRLALVILDASGSNPLAEQMKRQRPNMRPGLSGSVLGTSNALIAYAAKEGSTAVQSTGDHSPYTAALLNDLFEPGLDIRLAFGRVRDEVLKATDNKQEPAVFGALGGGVLALVPAEAQAPLAPVADTAATQTDFRLIEKINTKGAWEVFLSQHPTGCYADLARARVAALEAGKDGAAAAAKPAAATSCEK